MCQGNFFVYHVTGSTDSRFIFRAYLKDIYRILKGIGKIQFVPDLTTLLICKFLNFTGVFTKKEIKVFKA